MPEENELFPGFNKRLENAVEIAVTNALAGIDIVNLKQCQSRLETVSQELARAQAQADVWQELAKRRKDDLHTLQEEVARLNARVAFLESVLENNAADEVAAKDEPNHEH